MRPQGEERRPQLAPAAKRILVVQPLLTARGGGHGVAAWTIEALKREHRLTLLSWRRPEFAEVNRIFGTALTADDFDCRLVAAPLWHLLALQPLPLALAKDSYLARCARRLAGRFDLLISTAGEHDLGGRGIQYVHFPRFAPVRPPQDLRAFYHHPLLVRVYRRGVIRFTGTSMARVRGNRTLANSDWVAGRYRDVHGADAETLHPPAAGPFPPVAWEARENGIVCIGRLAPGKRLEYVIEVVERVRARGHDLHLHIAGVAEDTGYAAHLRRQARQRAAWMTLHEGLSRAALCTLITRQRYGIHGMEEEHFGMGVAELVSGGCIAFVPASGGQREIVGNDPRLLFASAAEGADKIAPVMADADLQQTLRAALAPRRAAFTPEHFIRRMREVVAEFDS